MAAHLTMKCALLLFALAITQVVAGDQLKTICADDRKVELTRASELAALVSASSSQPDEAVCSPRIRAAIVELDQLVNSDNDNVCSPAKINQIRAYYAKFVDKKSLTSQHETKLPKALRDLFLSYGFGVSRMCKSSMISSLLTDAQNLLNENDFRQIEPLIAEGSVIAKMIKTPKDAGDLILPKDMFSVLLEKAKKDHDNVSEDDSVSLVLQPAAAKVIKRIQAVCSRRFQPIYEQLVLPLVTLSRIGLNYKGEEVNTHLEQMKTNKDVRSWYRIVYLCESLAAVEIFEASEVDDKKSVRVLTSDEADELRANQPTGGHEASDVAESISYHQSVQHKMDDLIVDEADKNMHKLVGKFEAHKSELRRIRSKVLRQMLSVMKEILKTSKLSFIGSLLKRGSASRMNEDLVKLVDQYTSRLAQESQDASSELSESGHTRVKRAQRGSMGGFVVMAIIIIAAITLIFVLAG